MIGRIGRGRLRSPFATLYEEEGLPPAIRRSITFMILANILGNLYGVTVSGNALTGYAAALGATDFEYGLLTGIPLAASLMQIPAAMLVSRTQKRKQYILTYGIICRALWLVIGLVPFFVPMEPAPLRLWIVIFLIGVSAASGSFINVSFTPWLADLVPIGIRGRWLSIRDGFSNITAVLIGLLTAWLLDHIPSTLNYTIVFVMAGILGVMDMLCFIGVQEVHKTPPTKVHLGRVLRQIVADRPFFLFLLFWTAWNFTANICGPYLARYALFMGLSFMELTLYGQIAAALIAVLVISQWGKLIDRFGTHPILWVSCVVAAVTPAFFAGQTQNAVWPLLLHSVIGAAFWSASNVAATNVLLTASADDQRPTYVAVFSCIVSLAGAFLGVLLGGALLDWLQGWYGAGHTFLGGQPDRYKLVVGLSVVTRLGIVLVFLPLMRREGDVPVRTMFRQLLAAKK